MKDLRARHLEPVCGDAGLVGHVLSLERHRVEACIGEQPAQARRNQTLADVRGAAQYSQRGAALGFTACRLAGESGNQRVHAASRLVQLSHRTRQVTCSVVVLVTLGGCKSKAAIECQTQFQQAQIIVQKESGTPSGLETSLAAVDKALAACRAADRDKEVEQLNLARNALALHVQTVKERSSQKKRVKPTPAELEELVKRGDPNCPKGMAYKPEGSDRQIKCIGLQPVRMNWQKARDYYSNLGFHVVTTEKPPSIRAERGSELFVFTYSKLDDPQPPRCLMIYPEASVPWQEAVSRATGAPIQKLKSGSPVPMADGDIALRVDEGKDKLVIQLGACGTRSPLAVKS